MNKKIYFILPLILVIGILIGFSLNASAQETSFIPNWVKNTAKYWVNGDVGDADFVKAIQWMVTQGIIVLPNNSQSTSYNNQQGSSTLQNNNPLTPILPKTSDLNSLWKLQEISSSNFASKKWGLSTMTVNFPIIPSSSKFSSVHVFNSFGTNPVNTYEILPNSTSQQIWLKSNGNGNTMYTIDIASYNNQFVILDYGINPYPFGVSVNLHDCLGQGEFTQVCKSKQNDGWYYDANKVYSKMIEDFKNAHSNAKQWRYMTEMKYDPFYTTACEPLTYSDAQSTNAILFCVRDYDVFVIRATSTDMSLTDDISQLGTIILNNISPY